jgi:hypothetical protein
MVISENGIFDSENEATSASASAIIARKMSFVSIVTSRARSDAVAPDPQIPDSTDMRGRTEGVRG